MAEAGWPENARHVVDQQVGGLVPIKVQQPPSTAA
jgi:hypothetical protein